MNLALKRHDPFWGGADTCVWGSHQVSMSPNPNPTRALTLKNFFQLRLNHPDFNAGQRGRGKRQFLKLPPNPAYQNANDCAVKRYGSSTAYWCPTVFASPVIFGHDRAPLN
eukprot:sb/3477241/